MSALEQEIQGLRHKAEESLAARGRAEAQREVASSRLAELRQAIQQEFGIAPEEAPALLQRLTSDLEAAVAAVRAGLEEAQA